MEDFLLIIRDGRITKMPPNIQDGTYKLVRITSLSEFKSKKLHEWEDICDYISYEGALKNLLLERTKNTLERTGFKYIEDLEGIDAKDIKKIKYLGDSGVALTIAICEMFSVNVESKESYRELIENCKNNIRIISSN